MLVKALLLGGGVLAFCAWEIWSIRRDERRSAPPGEDNDRKDRSTESGPGDP